MIKKETMEYFKLERRRFYEKEYDVICCDVRKFIMSVYCTGCYRNGF